MVGCRSPFVRNSAGWSGVLRCAVPGCGSVVPWSFSMVRWDVLRFVGVWGY